MDNETSIMLNYKITIIAHPPRDVYDLRKYDNATTYTSGPEPNTYTDTIAVELSKAKRYHTPTSASWFLMITSPDFIFVHTYRVYYY